MRRTIGGALACWVSASAWGAPVEVVVVPRPNAAIGMSFPDDKKVTWLEKTADSSWLGRTDGALIRQAETWALVPEQLLAWAEAEVVAAGIVLPAGVELVFTFERIEVMQGAASSWVEMDVSLELSTWRGVLARGSQGVRVGGTDTGPAVIEKHWRELVRKGLATPTLLAKLAEAPTPLASADGALQLKRCDKPSTKVQDAVSAVVVVRSGQSTGAGVTVSPDGFVVTAAHVLGYGDVKVRYADGEESPAEVVRVVKSADTALLRVTQPYGVCVAARPTAAALGEEVFAVGSPGGASLGFSMSKGIVSSVRDVDTLRLVQTDAAISPGSSGGPLMDPSGGWLGVLSFKLVGGGVEGIGFAVSAPDAVAALGITFAATTDPALLPTP